MITIQEWRNYIKSLKEYVIELEKWEKENGDVGNIGSNPPPPPPPPPGESNP